MFSESTDGDGGDWSVDYPRADVNLSIRLSELTQHARQPRHVGRAESRRAQLTDDLMFQCPFIMMTEVGSAYFSQEEAARLREYLLKGGFLWADDFWGSYAWEVWAREISKVLPPSEYPIVDLPLDHPIFHQQFQISNASSRSRRSTMWQSARRRHLGTRRRTAPSRTRARSPTSTAA